MVKLVMRSDFDATSTELMKKLKEWTPEYAEKQLINMLNGKQFGSFSDPGLEASIWCDDVYGENYEVFIVLGTGRLHYHRELAKRLNENQKLFVIDWNLPMIWHSLFYEQAEGLEKTKFYLCYNIDHLYIKVAELINDWLTRKIRFVILPPYEYFFKKEIEEISRRITTTITLSTVSTVTFDKLGCLWVRNMFENLEHIVSSIPVKNLFNKFSDMPAVIVSAGPSLEKNIELLNDIKDKALILCSGSAIDTMKVYNISPHFLFSFDGSEGNYPHFTNLESDNLNLIYTPELYPRILKEFKGRLIISESQNKNTYQYLKELGAPAFGEAKIGPSVANFALDVAVKMGCNPIVFIGQDLALTNNQSHARGNAFFQKGDEIATDKFWVEGNYVDKIETTRSLFSMLKYLEAQIREYSGVKLINATEGGAKVSNLEIATLKEVMEKFITKKHNINKMINDCLLISKIGCAKDLYINTLENVRKDIEKRRKQIESILKILIRLNNYFTINKNITTNKRKDINKIIKFENQFIKSAFYEALIMQMIFSQVFYLERHYKNLVTEQPEKVELCVAEYQRKLFSLVYLALKEVELYIYNLNTKLN